MSESLYKATRVFYTIFKYRNISPSYIFSPDLNHASETDYFDWGILWF